MPAERITHEPTGQPHGTAKADPLLSVCIATRNRSAYVGQTLDNVLEQRRPDVEIVVVDGASTDNTAEVVSARADVRYFPQETNSGIDADFDKAVGLASGKYCWLMSDDDLLAPDALARVLAACQEGPDAVIVDAGVWSADFSETLVPRRLGFRGVRRYGPGDADRLLAECAGHLTFIGALIVRRELWLTRERTRYYGTEFIHVGVLFQRSLSRAVIAIGEPLVRIRYGVGNWTARSFQVWMFKWPGLIWSFGWISDSSRAAVCPRRPWLSPAALLLYRAKGWYTWGEFRRFIAPETGLGWRAWLPALIALLPGHIVNAVVLAGLWPRRRAHLGGYYDLTRSRYYIGRRRA